MSILPKIKYGMTEECGKYLYGMNTLNKNEFLSIMNLKI